MPKTTISKLPIAARTAISIAAAILFALCACLLISAAAQMSEDPTAHLSLAGEIAFMLSMLLCGFLGAKFSSESRFACGLLAAGILLLFVIAASVAFGGTSFVKEVILAILGAFFAALGSLLGAREKKRKRKR